MFGCHYRVPIDIMYHVRIDDRKFSSVAEYERTLQDLYNVACDSMQARQIAAATYYDKKVVTKMTSYKWVNFCMFLLNVGSQRNLL